MAQTHELALRDYILGMKYQEIAAKYNVSIETVRSWKKRHRWERDKPIKKSAPVAPSAPAKKEKGCTRKKKRVPEEELTDKEQLFCYHYIRTWNATQSALLAGYSSNKFSAKTIGYNLLQRPRVRQELDRLRSLFRQELHVDIQDFLEFCLKVVGADIGDYLKFGAVDKFVFDDGKLIKDPDTGEYLKEPVNCVTLGESEQLDTSVISEIRQGRDGISIKLADKKWAWEQLIKYFDWLPDRWQRKMTEEDQRQRHEKTKAEIAKIKGDDSDDDEGTENFKDALMGKVTEVWGDGSEGNSV